MPLPIALLLAVLASQPPDSTTGRFYSGRDYGSESQFNPLSVIANEAWDISQLEGTSRSIPELHSAGSFGRLHGSVGHPLESIRREGARRFLTTEIVPTSFDRDRAQWIPNYQLHLVGGGMRYAALEEWWSSHGCEHPAIAAAATTMVADYMNEVSEISNNPSSRVADPVADLYFFDIGGILLFRIDAVKDFCSRTIQVMNWPLQPTWVAGGPKVENAGEYWAIKAPIPVTDRWKLFYHMGLGNIGGVSRSLGGGNDLSVAAGCYSRSLRDVDSAVRTARIEPKLGIFWDRNNSLMASAFWNSQSVDRFLVNIYPGVVPTGPIKLGIWLSTGGSRGTHAGVTGTLGLGAGI